MSQNTRGLRAALSSPLIYDLFQDALGASKFRRRYVADFVRPTAGCRILDIGCGTAAILDFLPESVDYMGFDASEEYIAAAERKYGHRARFRCQLVDEMALAGMEPFDIVMANGLMHHLDDAEAESLAGTARKALRPGGRFVTHDPCYAASQSAMARFLISRDRGENVRTLKGYSAIVGVAFDSVSGELRHDMANIPYTHGILQAEA